MTSSQLFGAGMELEYPTSLGDAERYLMAQQAVDYLADQGFPVQNVEIVGTELRSIERVPGRLTRGKIAAAGALSGLSIGLFVGIASACSATATSSASCSPLPCSERCSGWRGVSWPQRSDKARHPRLRLGQPGRRHQVRGVRGAYTRRSRA
jgi:hypothetical protein